ncbi:MAG: lycopene cyclase domain-containing protein [Chloroflexi bacterium]|nr:lycopene cyclase domain-containing protein [Chloroflexota bacterium]
MTYFGFLGVFLITPIILLIIVAAADARRGRLLPETLRSWPIWVIILAHAMIALIYTTPWDNYLVATRVWWYQPELVTGVLIGYVPIEEYTFFVLQPILTGLWLMFLARHLPINDHNIRRGVRVRRVATLVIGALWLGAAVMLSAGWQPGTYLGLLLVWALPPVMLQLAFGADILWRHRRLVFLSIVPMTLYLSAADKLAITSGTWTINPEQSLNIFLLGRLPLEEFLFFFMTNTLITLGVTLFTAAESQARARRWAQAAGRVLKRRGVQSAAVPSEKLAGN